MKSKLDELTACDHLLIIGCREAKIAGFSPALLELQTISYNRFANVIAIAMIRDPKVAGLLLAAFEKYISMQGDPGTMELINQIIDI